jgi:streptomycin 6-kinase
MIGPDRPLPLPPALVEAAAPEGRTAWLATLPAALGWATHAWSLTVGPPFQPGGRTAWVAPARDGAGRDLVLKLAYAHPEARDEADGLRAWAGQGAVRLHAAADLGDTAVLLLERCRPGNPLSSRPEAEQDAVIGDLLRRLWAAPIGLDRFRPLQTMCDAWADEFEVHLAVHPDLLDPGLARAGIALFRAMPATAQQEVLLATDLHAGNILAAQREPWLMIDPKPYVGDPAYDVLQHLLNCEERLRRDPVGLVARMADLLALPRLRLRRWLFARCVQEAAGRPSLVGIARLIPID